MARGRPKLEKTIRRELRRAAAEDAKTIIEKLEEEIEAKIDSTPKGRIPGLS